jgi:hypothetical protein
MIKNCPNGTRTRGRGAGVDHTGVEVLEAVVTKEQISLMGN